MRASRFLVILGFIAIGMLSRLFPHPPNFTSINAIALFGTFYLGNQWLSLATVFSTVFLSDLFLGSHSTIPFVYLSFGLSTLLGHGLKEGNSLRRISMICFFSSLLFFLVTNFGVWMTNTCYPKTMEGLWVCYLAALPFFTNQILGDLAYASLLFGFISFVKAFKPSAAMFTSIK